MFKSVKPDELTFYIMDRAVGSVSRGTYTFPAGSNFTIRRMILDVYRQLWIRTDDIISWEDITVKDDEDEKDIDQDESKEENNMNENNVTTWLPCVISDGTWSVNEDIHKGDHIYRIFNDKIDIKANMTINHLGYYMIGIHIMDAHASIFEFEIDDSMRVCLTSSENDPGMLVMKQKLNFNTELTPGCLYRVVDSALNFKYLMYIRRFNGAGYIDADIMKVAIHGVYSKINTEPEQLSVIDLKGLMFSQIPLSEGCNLKLG